MEHIYTKHLFIIHLKFKFIGLSCNLLGNILLGEMTDSITGARKIQDEPETPCWVLKGVNIQSWGDASAGKGKLAVKSDVLSSIPEFKTYMVEENQLLQMFLQTIHTL